MIIREARLVDKIEIDRIYNKFYINNEYPNFFGDKNFQCAFVITDDISDKVILAGGIKTIVEAVFVTDKNQPSKVRIDALLQGLGSSIFIAQGMKYHQIHAFVNHDEKFINALQKFGFKVIDAKLLVLDFGESNG